MIIIRLLTQYILPLGLVIPVLALSRANLSIISAEDTHHFIIELAKTPTEKSRGLMHRTSLPVDQGMLFLYKKPQKLSMWMKNTNIPLDMLFISSDGIVDQVVPNTTPHSLTYISSKSPVIAVLEINAGLSEEYGIKAGDRIQIDLSSLYIFQV